MFDQIEVGPLLTCAALVVKYTTLEGESFVYANHLNSGNLNNSARQHLETIAKNVQPGSIQPYYYTGHEDLDDSNISDIAEINQSLKTQVNIQYNDTDGCPYAVEIHSELSTLNEKLMQIDQPNINNLQGVLIDLDNILQKFNLIIPDKVKVELLDIKLQLNLPFLPAQKPDSPHLFYQQQNMHQTSDSQLENSKCV
ncbi:hypothetical protein L3V83_00195 [Thiotrichales bacterium 19X7-9]|nr:hypothetical protein [Thiotrichales bacterium 19X7-9]